MSKRLWAYLGTAAVCAVVVDGILLLRGGDLVLATLVVLVAVATIGLAVEASSQSGTTWNRQPTFAPDRAPSESGLAGLRRLITDNQTARTPDRALQERLLRLADARRGGRSSDGELLARLRDAPRPIRFSPTDLSRLIDEIEEL